MVGLAVLATFYQVLIHDYYPVLMNISSVSQDEVQQTQAHLAFMADSYLDIYLLVHDGKTIWGSKIVRRNSFQVMPS